MANANFTVEGASVPPEYAGSYSQTIDLALVSTSGVRTVAWSVVGKSRNAAVNPTITPAGSPLGATASFNMGASPGGTLGVSFLIQCVVNGGTDDEGIEDSNLTKRAVVGVANGAGIVPVAFGETLERDAALGYTEEFNSALNAAGGGGSLSAPADPGDDGKVAIASGGDLSYVAGSAAGQVLVWTGASEWAAGAVNLADTDAVTNRLALSNFSNLNALSVLGVAGNVGGEAASIEATNDNHVLRRSGTSIGFGTIAAGGIASNAVTTTKILDANVTFAKIENGSACSLLGVAANSSGAHASIGAGTNGFVFCRRSNAVTAALLLNENIDASAAIAHSKLANITQGRVLGRADATGAPQELVAQNGVQTNGTDDSLELEDSEILGGELLNLGKTGSVWRAVAPVTTKFNADAHANFATADTIKGIVTNTSLTDNVKNIIIDPQQYAEGTIINVIYLHNSGVAFTYAAIVTPDPGGVDGGIDLPQGVSALPDLNASMRMDFMVRAQSGTETGQQELLFLGLQHLGQAHGIAF